MICKLAFHYRQIWQVTIRFIRDGGSSECFFFFFFLRDKQKSHLLNGVGAKQVCLPSAPALVKWRNWRKWGQYVCEFSERYLVPLGTFTMITIPKCKWLLSVIVHFSIMLQESKGLAMALPQAGGRLWVSFLYPSVLRPRTQVHSPPATCSLVADRAEV